MRGAVTEFESNVTERVNEYVCGVEEIFPPPILTLWDAAKIVLAAPEFQSAKLTKLNPGGSVPAVIENAVALGFE